MITEDYVSYETAKLLKKKGFDEATIGYYYTISEIPEKIKFFDSPISIYDSEGLIGCIQAPTIQMAMKWLREIYHIAITINYANICGLGFTYSASVIKINDNREIEEGPGLNACVYGASYEEACEKAIKYCLENLI